MADKKISELEVLTRLPTGEVWLVCVSDASSVRLSCRPAMVACAAHRAGRNKAQRYRLRRARLLRQMICVDCGLRNVARFTKVIIAHNSDAPRSIPARAGETAEVVFC